MCDISVTWQPGRVDWTVHAWTMTTALYYSVGAVDTRWVSMCTVWTSHSKWLKWVERQICLKLCIKLEHFSMETIWMIQKATAMDNWWLAASSRQLAHSCITFCAEFWGDHQITQVTQPPYSPDLAPWDLWLFPKLKSPLKRQRFQTVDEIQENMTGQLMAIGRTV